MPKKVIEHNINTTLPRELLQYIFQFLDNIQDAIRVCRLWFINFKDLLLKNNSYHEAASYNVMKQLRKENIFNPVKFAELQDTIRMSRHLNFLEPQPLSSHFVLQSPSAMMHIYKETGFNILARRGLSQRLAPDMPESHLNLIDTWYQFICEFSQFMDELLSVPFLHTREQARSLIDTRYTLLYDFEEKSAALHKAIAPHWKKEEAMPLISLTDDYPEALRTAYQFIPGVAPDKFDELIASAKRLHDFFSSNGPNKFLPKLFNFYATLHKSNWPFITLNQLLNMTGIKPDEQIAKVIATVNDSRIPTKTIELRYIDIMDPSSEMDFNNLLAALIESKKEHLVFKAEQDCYEVPPDDSINESIQKLAPVCLQMNALTFYFPQPGEIEQRVFAAILNHGDIASSKLEELRFLSTNTSDAELVNLINSPLWDKLICLVIEKTELTSNGLMDIATRLVHATHLNNLKIVDYEELEINFSAESRRALIEAIPTSQIRSLAFYGVWDSIPELFKQFLATEAPLAPLQKLAIRGKRIFESDDFEIEFPKDRILNFFLRNPDLKEIHFVDLKNLSNKAFNNYQNSVVWAAVIRKLTIGQEIAVTKLAGHQAVVLAILVDEIVTRRFTDQIDLSQWIHTREALLDFIDKIAATESLESPLNPSQLSFSNHPEIDIESELLAARLRLRQQQEALAHSFLDLDDAGAAEGSRPRL